MEYGLKTKQVSELLGVNPTTVQRWIKYFNIPCEMNEQGHYLIAEGQLHIFKNIKEQLNNGLTMKEILEKDGQGDVKKEARMDMISANVVEEKLERLMIQIEQLERKLAVKADEVVEYQVLQHRTELDSLFTMVSKVEERMRHIEQNLTIKKKVVGETVIEVPSQIKKPKKNKLMRIFSF